MLKKIASSFLAVLLVTLLIPPPINTVWAEATQVADDFLVENLKYTLYSEVVGDETVYTATLKGYNDGPTGELTIPDKVTYTDSNEYTVTYIEPNAFHSCQEISSVTIENSVASIGDYAFVDCGSLTSITIKDSMTSIGNGAFANCDSLTFVTIETSITSIGDNAFANCYGLTSVTLGEGITSIGDNAFAECFGLTSITIPDSVTSIGNYAFGGCNTLTSVTLGEGVTSIGDNAFSGCTGLTSVTLGEGITSLGHHAFVDCSGLTSITIPDSVTSIGKYAFSGCTGLTSVTIGNGVTNIGNYAFQNCSGLTSVTIGNSVTSIGDNAFIGCNGLTSITIPNSVNYIASSAFNTCISLSNIFYTKKIDPEVTPETNKIQYQVSGTDANGTVKVIIEAIGQSAANPITTFSCNSMGSGYSIVGLSEELTDDGITLSEHTFSGGWTLYDADPTKHIRTCSKCGLAETQDHDDKGAECVSNNDATCTEDGTETATCSVCNEQYVRTASGTATGHDFNVDLTTSKITCKNAPCDFEANISYDNVNIPTPTVTISSPATVEQNAKATVTVGTSNESKIFTDITVEGSILPGPIVDTSKKVVLTRTTKDLNYKEDGGKPDGVTGTKLPTKVPSPTDPEVYTYENFDGEKFTLELTYKEDIHIQDYRITADGAVVNITGEISTDQETQISTVKYEIPLSAGTTNINVECPFDANRDGTFKTGRDYIGILNTPWRKE